MKTFYLNGSPEMRILQSNQSSNLLLIKKNINKLEK